MCGRGWQCTSCHRYLLKLQSWLARYANRLRA
jgi:hypothetical protein